jgi:4'-phosphopantetheinyl transferase
MEPEVPQPRLGFHWLAAKAPVAIRSDQVDVWRAHLDVGHSHTGELEQFLSQDELARAKRFYVERDRNRFVVARGLLRSILGRYLDIEPSHIEFIYGPYGKPSLADEFAVQGIRFNLSHSDGLALYAIACGREVGVDVERLRLDFPGREIAERFFSPREVAMLFALPSNRQPEAFFNCWTRKEAYIKARGEGLSVPLSDFDVSLAPGEPARLLYTSAGPNETSRWTLRELNLYETDFVAAVAVEGHDWRLKCWSWL